MIKKENGIILMKVVEGRVEFRGGGSTSRRIVVHTTTHPNCCSS